MFILLASPPGVGIFFAYHIYLLPVIPTYLFATNSGVIVADYFKIDCYRTKRGITYSSISFTDYYQQKKYIIGWTGNLCKKHPDFKQQDGYTLLLEKREWFWGKYIDSISYEAFQ